MEIAQVAIEDAAPSFDKLYSYEIPPGMAALAGCRVRVPFGRAGHTRFGIVMNTAQTNGAQKLKLIESLVDERPLLDGEGLWLVRILRETTFCGYYDAVRTLLPPGIGVQIEYYYALERGWRELAEQPGQTSLEMPDGDESRVVSYLDGRGRPVMEKTLCAALGLSAGAPVLRRLCESGVVLKSQRVKRRVQDEKQVMARLAPEILRMDDITRKLTPSQQKVVRLLLDVGQGSVKEICYFAVVGKSVLDRLEAAGILQYFTREIYRSPLSREQIIEPAAKPPPLSEQQQSAYEKLRKLYESGKGAAALLYGVTGSGKTQVFMSLIEHVLASGRGVIVMVPEISLTPQTVNLFRARFGGGIAVLHSALTMGERADEWKRIKRGEVMLAVGTRSAVFAPVHKLGLIVMDEEQESSYKSERSPRYHARDIARARASRNNALLLMASATPAIDSFYRAVKGDYTLLRLDKRYGRARLPDVTLLDMAAQPLDHAGSSFSAELREQLLYNIEAGEQSVLLLNRRGHNTLVKCAVCGNVMMCPNCSVALTYHSANDSLMCHYCGHMASVRALCPVCGSSMQRYAGTGTQRVALELEQMLPQARVLRMDMDTTMARFSHERHFGDFAAGKYDILLGTQMVAKGLDFPNVTLVGVLNADSALFAPDYRGLERAFSLFTQVVGRGGRAKKAGRAYIQTFSPDSSVLQLAARQDYDGFYAQEIENRQAHLYPPFCRMAGIGFTGADEAKSREASSAFAQTLKELAAKEYGNLPLRLLGPCRAQLYKAAGKYRWQMAVKCVYNARTRELLRRALEWYYAQKHSRDVAVFIDPYYESAI